MRLEKINLQTSGQDSALLNLLQNTGVPGALAYVYERPSGYEAFARTQGHSFEVYGVWESDELLGATQITYDRVHWNGGVAEVAYSGDTRVLPKARGKRLADLLIEAACLQSAAGSLPVLGAVMGSNAVVLEKKLGHWRKIGVDFRIVGELRALIFRARKRRASAQALRARVATPADLPAMFALWQKEQSKKNLGRHYPSPEDFQKAYETTPGIALSETWVVEEASGRVSGFLSLWDQSAIRKIRVQRLSGFSRLARSLLSPWLKIPRVGEELKIAYAFQAVVDTDSSDGASALEALVLAAQTRAAELGFILFSLGMDARDPAFLRLKKRALTTNAVKIIAANAQLEDRPDPRLFHLEVGLG